MGRKPKIGLDYFPLDVNFFDDYKIMDLSDECGAEGVSVYIATLTMVYSKGYFLEFDSIDKLALLIIRKIGSKGICREEVIQTLRFCSEKGLFDKELFEQNVITSTAIQERYDFITQRNVAPKEKYWLIGENVGEKSIPATEMKVSATEKPIDAARSAQRKEKERKENNIIYIESFEALWKEYPNKADKVAAYKCYQARLEEGYSEKQLLRAVENYADECKRLNRTEQYVKHAKTFLGLGKPFEEYLTEEKKPKETKSLEVYEEYAQMPTDEELLAEGYF